MAGKALPLPADLSINHEDEIGQHTGQLEGRYANYFQVGYNAFEFLFDFGQSYVEGDGAQVHTRIISGPAYAKALFATLRDSLDRYEQAFGPIPKENEERNRDAAS